MSRQPVLNSVFNSITNSIVSSVFIAIVCFFSAPSVAQTAFSKLIVFGDSLSDTGNLAFVDLPFPYFENRISDGLVLADYVAAEVNSSAQRSGHLLGQEQGFNFAVAGGNIIGSDDEDLGSQVSAYLDRSNGIADPNALYLVFAGGNDLRDFRSRVNVDADISLAINTMDALLQRLVDAGARAFMVPNVANIGRIPETLAREAGDPGISARAKSHTRRYNQALSVMLDKYRSMPNLALVEFDLFTALESVLDNPVQNGFSTVTEGCFDPSEFTIEAECLLFGFARRPFFDNLHPSSATNRLISQAFIAQLPGLPTVPEPDSTVLAPILLLLLSE